MQLSEYAKQMGVRYETAWRWFRDGKGKMQGRCVGTRTSIMTEGQEVPAIAGARRVVISARVSTDNGGRSARPRRDCP